MSDSINLQDALNFVSTVWTNIQLDIDNEEFVSEREYSLQDAAAEVLESNGIHPEVHYLKFLQNDKPGSFVILDGAKVVLAEFETAEKCVEAFHEDVDGFHRVYFLEADEREYYEFAD